MIDVSGGKFLVTGAAGFIGSHIVEELVKQGKRVVAVDDLSAGKIENLEPWRSQGAVDFRPIDISMCHQRDMADAFDGVDVVFHNAASKCTVCRDKPMRDLLVNAFGSWRVFDAAVNAGAKVVHASTGSVYGDCGHQHEDQSFAPKSFYGVSKAAGESYLRAFSEYHGLRWVALRYFHVFGPRQESADHGGVIPIFIRRMISGEPVRVFGDGEQTRVFTYVKDVVKANFLAANSESMDGRAFNVAAAVPVTLNMLIREIEDITGIHADVRYEDARPGDIRDFYVDNSRLLSAGFGRFRNHFDALMETVCWYKRALSVEAAA